MIALVTGQIAIDTTTPFDTDGTGVVTFPNPTTVGNFIGVVIGCAADRTISDVADDGAGGTNVFAETTRSPLQAGAGWSQISYAPIERASQTVTVTVSSASAAVGFVAALEFTELDVADLLEAQAQDNVAVAGMSHPTGDVATTIADSLLLACLMGGAGTYTNDANGWVEIFNLGPGGQVIAAYKILTATTTESWTPTSAANENTSSSIAAFNGVVSVAGTRFLLTRF